MVTFIYYFSQERDLLILLKRDLTLGFKRLSSPNPPDSWLQVCECTMPGFIHSFMTVSTAEITVGKYHSFLIVATWFSIGVNSQSDWTNEQVSRRSFAICASIFILSAVFLELHSREHHTCLFCYRPAYYIHDASKVGSLCMQPALYKLEKG